MSYFNIPSDKRFAYLQDLAKQAGFPIIMVSEHTNMDYYSSDDSYIPNFRGDFVFDTKHLVSNDDDILFRIEMDLNYIGEIVESALKGQSSCTSSHKYSFGDTVSPKAYDPIDSENRTLISIDVDVNH